MSTFQAEKFCSALFGYVARCGAGDARQAVVACCCAGRPCGAMGGPPCGERRTRAFCITIPHERSALFPRQATITPKHNIRGAVSPRHFFRARPPSQLSTTRYAGPAGTTPKHNFPHRRPLPDYFRRRNTPRQWDPGPAGSAGNTPLDGTQTLRYTPPLRPPQAHAHAVEHRYVDADG